MKNKNRVRVLLVNDQSIVRDGLKLILESFDVIEVCGEVKDIKETIDVVSETRPEVILLDTNLLDGKEINECSRIKSMCPDVKLLILSECSQEYNVVAALGAGVDCYLLKNVTKDELVKNIIKVYKGECVLDPSLAKYAINFITRKHRKINHSLNHLSQRETDILQMISYGKSNKEIAVNFSIAEKTVRNYISNIFKKINVSNRTEAAVYWLEHQKALA